MIFKLHTAISRVFKMLTNSLTQDKPAKTRQNLEKRHSTIKCINKKQITMIEHDSFDCNVHRYKTHAGIFVTKSSISINIMHLSFLQ